ncbi:MAG: CRISPR-associated endonuclease Cas2 [Spirochaetales bacterium]
MNKFPLMSKYELMWMMVLFDLPVVETQERKDATAFRNFLLDCGFSMVQYSIYIKILSGTDACDKYYNLIEKSLPKKGKVDILTITDRQYENIKSYCSRDKIQKKNQSQQYLLF